MIYNDPTGEFFWVAALWTGIFMGLRVAVEAYQNGGDVLGSFLLGFGVGYLIGGLFGDAVSFDQNMNIRITLFKTGPGTPGGGVLNALVGGEGMKDWVVEEREEFNDSIVDRLNQSYREIQDASYEQYLADQSGEPNGSGGFAPILENMLQEDNPWYYFGQRDPRWANIIYSILDPSDPEYPQTIASSGCGPTSIAMVITKLTGEYITPVTTAQFALDNGYRTPYKGTSWSYFGAIGTYYGLTVIETTNFYDAKRFLRNRDCIVIASMGPGHFTTTGHFIVLDSTSTFTTHVLDPNRFSNNHNWWDLIIAMEGRKYFIFMK